MFTTIKNIWNDESGATAIEYGLIAALISIVAISAMQLTGDSLSSAFDRVSTDLSTAVATGTEAADGAAADGAAADAAPADGG